MARTLILKRGVLFLHRWMGTGLCLIFLVRFLSGIVMMYFDFPSVKWEDRLDRSPRIDASQIRTSPQDAFVRLGLLRAPSQIRLVMYDGRPLYIFGAGRNAKRVYADSGEIFGVVTTELATRVASHWCLQPATLAKREPVERPDQWTVPCL
jgi:hypothetical protein